MLYAENKHAQVVSHDLPVTGTHRFSDAQRYCLKHRTCSAHGPLCAQTSEGKWHDHREVQLPRCTPGNLYAEDDSGGNSRLSLKITDSPSEYTSQTHHFSFLSYFTDPRECFASDFYIVCGDISDLSKRQSSRRMLGADFIGEIPEGAHSGRAVRPDERENTQKKKKKGKMISGSSFLPEHPSAG